MTSILLICLGIILIILSLIVWMKNEEKNRYFDEIEYNKFETLDHIKHLEQKIGEFEQIIFELEKKIREIYDYMKIQDVNEEKEIGKVLMNSNQTVKNSEFKNFENINLVNEVQKLKHNGFKNVEIAKMLNRSIREIDMILKLKEANK
ncbi:hypothetical protein Y919_03980 [Caloranaerobacter azorensis H53214]|uniref:Uncharacterized protein n=1 Tax=Caloranaerobacter azorensis H53214 TaxID=1156417 RepID=A0A096BI00_9FIRM|nr:hypothetical protein [Caloranaerobacter azorensis]KGG80830.1 hypothetical protein Y919_03980 [Caloranaerobacter azorensis H53214]